MSDPTERAHHPCHTPHTRRNRRTRSPDRWGIPLARLPEKAHPPPSSRVTLTLRPSLDGRRSL